MKLQLQPINQDEAFIFIKEHHRHHLPPRGWKFGIAINAPGFMPGYPNRIIVGVITIGRPVARRLNDGYTLEVTRCCTIGAFNSASMLYGAAWRAVRAMGYRRLITYTLVTEPGTSLRAAGWKNIGITTGKTWSRAARPRIDKHPLGQKAIWEANP